jgi:hypothetical protein
MTPRHKRLAITLLSGVLLLSGCQNPFNPDTHPAEVSNTVTTASNTPEELLKNLETAYQTQDIDLYKKCLSEDFKFVLLTTEVSDIGTDMDNDGIRDNWWGYSEEVRYHENLFSQGSSDGKYASPYQINLSLRVPTRSVWTQCTETGYEGVLIIPCGFDLRLCFSQSTDIASSGTALFYIRQEGSEWRILRWLDESSLF